MDTVHIGRQLALLKFNRGRHSALWKCTVHIDILVSPIFDWYSLTYSNYLQETDQFTAEPPQANHRCTAPREKFFSSEVFQTKTAAARRIQITEAASLLLESVTGKDLRGMKPGPVMDWGEAPSQTCSPGLNASHYEHFREQCGVYLVYNAFWNVKNF